MMQLMLRWSEKEIIVDIATFSIIVLINAQEKFAMLLVLVKRFSRNPIKSLKYERRRFN